MSLQSNAHPMDLPAVPPGTAKVAILLGTMNGENYIESQLQSYVTQTHSHWALFVSDDGSADATLKIVRRFADKIAQQVVTRTGPHGGFCRNFMSLAGDPAIEADYFAFSDQDDIWYPDKLERALRHLAPFSQNTPAVYFSRTELVDENGAPIGFSPLFQRQPSFRNALVQSIGGGNTTVFNRPAKTLFEKSGHLPVVSHDWWAYQLITGAGGTACYDPQPTLKYRQHRSNVLGANTGLRARLMRTRMLLSGRFARWNDVNLQALASVKDLLTPDNVRVLEAMTTGRRASLLSRLMSFRRAKVYRQTTIDNLGMAIAIVFNKF